MCCIDMEHQWVLLIPCQRGLGNPAANRISGTDWVLGTGSSGAYAASSDATSTHSASSHPTCATSSCAHTHSPGSDANAASSSSMW